MYTLYVLRLFNEAGTVREYAESNDGVLDKLWNKMYQSKWSGLVPTSVERYCKHPHIIPMKLMFQRTLTSRTFILQASSIVFLKMVYQISPLCTAVLDTLIVAQPANKFPYNTVSNPSPDTIMHRYTNVVPNGTLRLPWLRFLRAFSSVVRQMSGYNSQRRGTPRTIPS